jgi:hypothetical protein
MQVSLDAETHKRLRVWALASYSHPWIKGGQKGTGGKQAYQLTFKKSLVHGRLRLIC